MEDAKLAVETGVDGKFCILCFAFVRGSIGHGILAMFYLRSITQLRKQISLSEMYILGA